MHSTTSALRRFAIVNTQSADWGLSDWFTPHTSLSSIWVRANGELYGIAELVPTRYFHPANLCKPVISGLAYALPCAVRMAVLASFRACQRVRYVDRMIAVRRANAASHASLYTYLAQVAPLR